MACTSRETQGVLDKETGILFRKIVLPFFRINVTASTRIRARSLHRVSRRRLKTHKDCVSPPDPEEIGFGVWRRASLYLEVPVSRGARTCRYVRDGSGSEGCLSRNETSRSDGPASAVRSSDHRLC